MPGESSRQYCDRCQTPLGTVYIVMSGEKLSGLSFENPHMRLDKAPQRIRQELCAYFEGSLREFSLDYALECGTGFERKVWLTLLEIPYGETRSYKWMAERVGTPRGSRAVGQALKKNPLPIVLPCHRVIESGGGLGGFAPGPDIKRRLLQMEFYHLRESGGDRA